MLCDALDPVYTEVNGLVRVPAYDVCNQIEIVVREHQRRRAQAVVPPGPVHAVVFYGYLPPLGNAVGQLPQHLLDALAVVLDFGVVVQLPADKLVELGAVGGGGEPLQAFNQGHQLFPGKRPDPYHHLYQRK